MCSFSTAREQGKVTSAGAEHRGESSGDLSLVELQLYSAELQKIL